MVEKKDKAVTKAARFDVAELLKHADAFGTTPELLSGALHGKGQVTKAEAQQLLEQFKKKGVMK